MSLPYAHQMREKNDHEANISNANDHQSFNDERQDVTFGNQQPKKRSWLSHKAHPWAWATFWVLFLLVILLLLFLLIIPKVVQNIVSKAELPVYSASLTNPTPNTIDFGLNSSIHTPAGLTAKQNALPLKLSGTTNNESFATIVLPEAKLRGHNTVELTNHTTNITNMDSFVAFLKTSMYNKNFSMKVDGNTNTYLGAIKAPIHMEKTKELAGLDKLSGFALQDPHMVSATDLVGTAILPNPSVFTIELGTLEMDITISGILIANATMDNVVLRPGVNEFTMRATNNMTAITENMMSIYSLQPDILTSGAVIVSKGRSVTFKGQRIPYYEEVMAPLEFSTTIPIVELMTQAKAFKAAAGNSTSSISL